MIDKIIARGEISKNSKLDLLSLNLQLKKEYDNGFKTNWGNLGNLKVEIDFDNKHNPTHISVFGSPVKYAYGNNVNNYTYSDLKYAFFKVSEDLGLDYLSFDVNSLEVGANFIMMRDPKLYLSSIIDHKQTRMKLSIFRDYESIYLANRTRKEIIFYNKSKESKSYIPEELKGLHILRYELKLKSKINEVLKKSVNVRNLLDKDLYNHLLYLWYTEYLMVQKEKNSKLNFKPTITRIKNFLVQEGIRNIGYKHLLNYLEESFKENHMKGNEVTRPRNWIKNQMQNNDNDFLNLNNELDRNVERAFLSHLVEK